VSAHVVEKKHGVAGFFARVGGTADPTSVNFCQPALMVSVLDSLGKIGEIAPEGSRTR